MTIMIKHLLLFLSLSTWPTFAVPRPGTKAFNPNPRPGLADWNAPRPDQAAFLARRSGLLSEEYFNNPPVKRVPSASREPLDDVSNHLDPQPRTGNSNGTLAARATPGQWENMQGSGNWHPAAVSWGGGRQDVFHAGKDGRCKHQYRDGGGGGGWQPAWYDLGGSLDSAPACCSRKANNMHVFCKGTDGQAWHRAYDPGSSSGGGGWGGWQALGGTVKHHPSACSWDRYHVSVHVSSSDSQCWHRRYDDDGGSGWGGWENLGGYLDGPPRAVTWGKGHTSVFCKGNDGQAWHRKYEGSAAGWGGWESLGGTLDGEVAACAWNGRMDIFVKGTDGVCWHKTYRSGGGWGGWVNLGGRLKAGKAPDVVVIAGKIEVYIVQDDNAVYRKIWQNDRWTPNWEYMGGNVNTKPSVVVWDGGKVDVYAGAADGTCRRCY
ncbi:hypothetical protein VTK26DRAFT_6585 [Humicola hyalothermophila]